MNFPIEIKGFPLPPSANALYLNIPGRGRCKSAALTKYESDVRFWCLRNQHQMNLARELTIGVGPGVFLKVSKMFFMKKKSILKKDGTPKRNDTSNRIKALEDVLSKLLGIDDKWFWAGTYDKRPTPNPALPEHVDIRLELYEPDLSCATFEEEDDDEQ